MFFVELLTGCGLNFLTNLFCIIFNCVFIISNRFFLILFCSIYSSVEPREELLKMRLFELSFQFACNVKLSLSEVLSPMLSLSKPLALFRLTRPYVIQAVVGQMHCGPQ